MATDCAEKLGSGTSIYPNGSTCTVTMAGVLVLVLSCFICIFQNWYWRHCSQTTVHAFPVASLSERASSFQHYADNADQWSRQKGAWRDQSGSDSVSGAGSEALAVQPFSTFLLDWMMRYNITSMVEASCGHWPTGWQKSVQWPPIKYTGVDLLMSMVEDSSRFLQNHISGFSGVEFLTADMTSTPLPGADLLLVKDTLQHLPNMDIMRFLLRQILTLGDRRPKFKYVIIVEDDCSDDAVKNIDIPPLTEHSWHCVDVTAEPFNLEVEHLFAWQDANPAWTRVKVARLLKLYSN